MRVPTTTILRMSPRQRKILDPAKLNERFGLHFQGLLDATGLDVKELRMRLAKGGHNFSEAAIRNWMRGTAFPSPFAMEALAAVLKVPDADYRHILPPAIQKRLGK